jgi:hypothetical protein
VLEGPTEAGHVDHVVIPAGALISFPGDADDLSEEK